MAKVAVILAPGFEEVEALTPIDLLRRAGNEVFSVSLSKEKTVVGARKISVNADLTIDSLLLDDWDCVVVPGGMPGTLNIAASEPAVTFIGKMFETGKLCSAICAAPAHVFSKAGILNGKKYTCYPGDEKVSEKSGGIFSEERVVEDSNIITSRAPGTAMEFSLALITRLNGAETAEKIGKAVLFAG